jgi:hypothetical protein
MGVAPFTECDLLCTQPTMISLLPHLPPCCDPRGMVEVKLAQAQVMVSRSIAQRDVARSEPTLDLGAAAA